ncbi:MAG: response regulator [Planctomycetaceae bacterium]
MGIRALIVEDDPDVLPWIESSLLSIGHEYDWVSSQLDAQQKLAEQAYRYVLLDLQIPATAFRGGADKEYGINLLSYIRKHKGERTTPVIMMTAATSAGLDLSRELFQKGAADMISKPLDKSVRPLIRVIEQVLQEPDVGMTSQTQSSLRPFTGGELLLFEDRAELSGVKIITDNGAGQSLNLLRTLSQQDSSGRFVTMSAGELVDAVGAIGGVGAITGSVRTIRHNVVERLRKHRGLVCEKDSLIRNDEQGYYLREWISVTGRDSGPVEEGRPEAPRMNERQEWILSELHRGVKLERVMIERRFGVHARTAKRDLAELNGRGLVEFASEGWKPKAGNQ